MSFTLPTARRRVACLLCSVRPQARTYAATPSGNPKPAPPASTSTSSTAATTSPAPRRPNDDGKRDASFYTIKIDAPRGYGKKVETFTPQVIPRPIGMLEPPRAGENAGSDKRTLAEKRADALNYDKLLQKRAELVKEFQRPYFRDIQNLRHHKGKTFIAPPRIFKAEHALYFPNIHGDTLEKKGWGSSAQPPNRDTTPVLRGRTSIVTVFSNVWAENQVGTFLSKTTNPELHEILKEYEHATPRPKGQIRSALTSAGTPLPGIAVPQIVRINIERDALRAWLVRMFFWGLRRHFSKPDWGKYFLVTGLADDIREATGMLNRTVGYVYLVDEHCRIRWAGSGDATEEERQSLTKGLRRLITQSDA